MNLAIAQWLTHFDQEYLVLVLRPLENIMPQHEGVTCCDKAVRILSFMSREKPTFNVIFQGQIDETTNLGEIGILGPTADRKLKALCQSLKIWNQK